MGLRRKLGQSILDYAILLGVITTTLVGMQFYIKRGIQAGIKVSADQLGCQGEGLKEKDMRSGINPEDTMKRTSNFTSRWNKEERLIDEVRREIYEHNENWGSSIWEGKSPAPFSVRDKYSEPPEPQR